LSAMPRSRPGSPRAGPDPHPETYRGASPRPARRAACDGPTVCRAPGLPFYLVLRRGIDRAGGQSRLSRFRPVPKTFQSRGECQISPDMALGTTGLNPDPEGLIFGVCQISASQDRLCTSPRLRVYPRQANPDLLARVGGRMRGEGRAASGDGMILSTTTEGCCSYLKP